MAKYQHRAANGKTKFKMRFYQTAKIVNARQCVKVLMLLMLGTLGTIIYFTNTPAPLPRYWVSNEVSEYPDEISQGTDHRSDAGRRIAAKVLVFVEGTHSALNRDIAELLVHNRIK